ncbi:hypothetical protein [Streptomyces sp. 6N223]|uniref:hypothetical protein n=1 Tax=Streptomyces sp. 6N223 TaxID=3457412 RepID=UPI003FD5D2D3
MAVTSETQRLSAELRTALSRHGVELNISAADADADPDAIDLGSCCPPTARRLLEVVRRVPPPRDLRAAVREANELSVRNRLIKEGLR